MLLGNPQGIVHKLGAPCSSLHGPGCSTLENMASRSEVWSTLKAFFVKLCKAEGWTPRTKPDSGPLHFF